MGVDDYIGKLVKFWVLLVCICVMLCWVIELGQGVGEEVNGEELVCLQFNDLVVDCFMCEVWFSDVSIDFISVEFDLFWLLVSNVGWVFSCEEIFMVLCGIEYDGQDCFIDVWVF